MTPALGWLAIAVARAEDAPEAPPAEADDAIVVQDDARKVPRVAGAAHVVGAETLERSENDDIHKVLATVPGVYVRGEDGFGLRPNIGMRGANSDRSAKITLLEDGVPLAPAPYAAPAAYTFPLTTRLVAVEVFKGPSAIAWGPQTIGGAVNLRTREVPEGPDGALDLARGTFGTFKAHAWAGTSNDTCGALLEVAHLSTDGFKQLDGGGSTGFERQDIMAKARCTLDTDGARHEWLGKVGVGREDSHETYLGLTPADFEATPYRRYAASSDDRMRWQASRESLTWQVNRHDAVTVRTVAYHAWLDRDWNKLNGLASGVDLHDLLQAPERGRAAALMAVLRGEEDTSSSDDTLRIGTNDRTFHQGGLQSVARAWRATGDAQHLLEVGARAHGERVRRVHTEASHPMRDGRPQAATSPTETTLNREADVLALAAWARDELTTGALQLVPGARVEVIGGQEADALTGTTGDATWRTALLPGVSAAWTARPSLVVFSGIHRGFSPLPPGSPPDLLPETAWNGEAGVRWFPDDAYLELTAFGSRYANLLGTCTLSSGCAEDALDRAFAGGAANVAGAEVTVSRTVTLPREVTLRGDGAYTYTHARFASAFASEFPQWGDVTPGAAMPYVPAHQVAATLTVQRRSLEASATATHRGAMLDIAGDATEAPLQVPAATIVDLQAAWRPTASVEVYALLRNATDTVTIESLRPFGARPGAPRTALVGVKVRPSPAR